MLVGTCTGELAWVGDDGLVKGERQHFDGRIDVLKVVPNATRTVLVGTHAGQIVKIGMDGVQASPLVAEALQALQASAPQVRAAPEARGAAVARAAAAPAVASGRAAAADR